MNKKVVIGFSCGDVNGVGLEVLAKAFSNYNLFDVCVPILYMPEQVLKLVEKQDFVHIPQYNVVKTPAEASSENINIISFFDDKKIEINMGKSTEMAAQIAIKSIDLALNDLNKNRINILLTLPVNKQSVSLIKKDFTGHTEYVSSSCNSGDSLMLLCHENLRIATATNHIPISQVSGAITKSLLKNKIKLLTQTLKIDFVIQKPKIAVLSLNPHAGDNGLIGKEDLQIIKPVVESFFKNGELVCGPYPADGFFGSGNYKNFDAILGMYHDQSLIPFKALAFSSGVNYTAGLPIIRVSPGHGVGYDIAGKGVADVTSFLSATYLGLEIHANRI